MTEYKTLDDVFSSRGPRREGRAWQASVTGRDFHRGYDQEASENVISFLESVNDITCSRRTNARLKRTGFAVFAVRAHQLTVRSRNVQY